MLDGEKVGETEAYGFTLTDVQPGKHVAQVIATYLNAAADPVEITFESTVMIMLRPISP